MLNTRIYGRIVSDEVMSIDQETGIWTVLFKKLSGQLENIQKNNIKRLKESFFTQERPHWHEEIFKLVKYLPRYNEEQHHRHDVPPG